MLYLYYGDDSFNSRETVRRLKEKFVATYDPGGHNVHAIDGDSFTLDAFFTVVKATGFLAKKKLLIVRNLFSSKGFGDVQDPLLEFLKTQKNTTDENYIVFWQDGVPRRTKLFSYLVKRLTPIKCAKEFTTLSGAALIRWLQQIAQRNGKTLHDGAAELLISLVGDDMWVLYHELTKLCHGTGETTITAERVEALIERTRGESIFSLVDAIGERRIPTALQLLDAFLAEGDDTGYILAMITRQFRLMVMAKDVSDTTENAYAVSQRLKLHPYVAKKMINQSRHYTMQELARVYQRLAALDLILKSDREKLKAALTLFVAEL